MNPAWQGALALGGRLSVPGSKDHNTVLAGRYTDVRSWTHGTREGSPFEDQVRMASLGKAHGLQASHSQAEDVSRRGHLAYLHGAPPIPSPHGQVPGAVPGTMVGTRYDAIRGLADQQNPVNRMHHDRLERNRVATSAISDPAWQTQEQNMIAQIEATRDIVLKRTLERALNDMRERMVQLQADVSDMRGVAEIPYLTSPPPGLSTLTSAVPVTVARTTGGSNTVTVTGAAEQRDDGDQGQGAGGDPSGSSGHGNSNPGGQGPSGGPPGGPPYGGSGGPPHGGPGGGPVCRAHGRVNCPICFLPSGPSGPSGRTGC